MPDFAFRLEKETHGQADHPAFKSFKIMENSKHVGNLHTESYGKRVEINDVEHFNGAHSIGPKHVRQLASQLKQHWPDMESVGGYRISGTRGRNGGATEVKVK